MGEVQETIYRYKITFVWHIHQHGARVKKRHTEYLEYKKDLEKRKNDFKKKHIFGYYMTEEI